jgi:hypothetical protein
MMEMVFAVLTLYGPAFIDRNYDELFDRVLAGLYSTYKCENFPIYYVQSFVNFN